MASESTPPPPPSGGGARYAILGVAMVALAALGWCLMGQNTTPTSVAALPDAGPPAPPRPVVVDELDIPDPEPDAGPPPDVGPPEEVRHSTGSSGGPRPPVGEWDRCAGDVNRAAIAAEVRAHDRQIRTCYERRLRDNPLLTGNVSLGMMIGADGHVTNVRMSGSLRDREFSSCVRAEAMRMHFPRVTGGTCAVVEVPYTFTPAN